MQRNEILLLECNTASAASYLLLKHSRETYKVLVENSLRRVSRWGGLVFCVLSFLILYSY